VDVEVPVGVSGRRTLLFVIATAGVAALGCGDGAGGSGTCASNASCGGNIVGTWTIVEACNTTTTLAPTGCAERTYTVTDHAVTGTFVFRADGTATRTLRTTGTITLSTPPVCLASAMETCADVDAAFKSLVQTGSGYTAASCADNGGPCVCTLMFDTMSNVSATYTASGSTVTVTSDGDNSSASYCVTGSTLVFSFASTTGDPPAVIVLTRN
jgi:hypothetical protein